MHSASMGIWLAEMNALSKRMGELRLTPAASGVWGRAFGQHQHLKVNAADRLSQTVEGIEIGADKGWSVRRGRWYVGGVAGYSHARRKWDHSARGDSDSVHVGAYATYIGDSGFYVDGIVRVNRYKHDVKVSHARGTRGGNYRANGAGLSLEAGKRISWGSDWFVEPQLEMAVLHLGGAHYTASNGMHVDIKSLKSVMGRVGLQLGRKFDLGGGKAVQPYAKLSWLQEFDGVARRALPIWGVTMSGCAGGAPSWIWVWRRPWAGIAACLHPTSTARAPASAFRGVFTLAIGIPGKPAPRRVARRNDGALMPL